MAYIPRQSTRISADEAQYTTQRITDYFSNPSGGLTALRDKLITSGSGAITFVSGSEFKLATGGDASSRALMETRRRGRYIAAFEYEMNTALRIPTAPSGTQYAQWGYFDANNGFGYGEDINGKYVFVRKEAVDEKIYQTKWNIDKLDGSGVSGITIDYSQGIVYEANFLWFGYGTIEFNFFALDTNDKKNKLFTGHRYTQTGSVSFFVSDQPISVETNNGADGGNFKIFLTCRELATIGGELSNFREPVADITGSSVDTSGFIPLISVRKKNKINGLDNTTLVRPSEIEILSNKSLHYQVIYSGTLTNDSFVKPPNWGDGESLAQIDTSATALSGGIKIASGFIAGDNSTKTSIAESTALQTVLDGNIPITLTAKSLSGVADVQAAIKWIEEW